MNAEEGNAEDWSRCRKHQGIQRTNPFYDVDFRTQNAVVHSGDVLQFSPGHVSLREHPADIPGIFKLGWGALSNKG